MPLQFNSTPVEHAFAVSQHTCVSMPLQFHSTPVEHTFAVSQHTCVKKSVQGILSSV